MHTSLEWMSDGMIGEPTRIYCLIMLAHMAQAWKQRASALARTVAADGTGDAQGPQVCAA